MQICKMDKQQCFKGLGFCIVNQQQQAAFFQRIGFNIQTCPSMPQTFQGTSLRDLYDPHAFRCITQLLWADVLQGQHGAYVASVLQMSPSA